MMRPLSTVLLEAAVIGIMNCIFIILINRLKLSMDRRYVYALAGALIHIVFEYSSGNEWWCKSTYD